MRLIGLIGGLSWESSAEYYRIINRAAQSRLGGVHSARILLYSFDFGEIEALQAAGRWDEATAMMVASAQSLERGGAEGLVICSNTMHRMSEAVSTAVKIPLLHIADATGVRIRSSGIARVGLLGTRFTMREDFYKGRLSKKFGLDVIVPDEADSEIVDRIIYEELVRGIVRPDSRRLYRDVIARLVAGGAQGVILGCTEIMLLVKPEDSPVPLFDTTTIHAETALDWALHP